jgi:bacillithiol system protein YtxJ
VISWKPLDKLISLDEAIQLSEERDVVLFKHSTTCSISQMAKMRLESSWDFAENEITPYFLDLRAHREISNAIAEKLSVAHESPQILLIRKGTCIYDASHFDISVAELKETIGWHV